MNPTFATRFHEATVVLEAGRSLTFRLPPISPGGVRVQIFRPEDGEDDAPHPHHPDFDPDGVDSPPPTPPRRPPVATDVELTLSHSSHLSKTSTRSVSVTSLWFDDLWRLTLHRKKRGTATVPPQSYLVRVDYTSQLPIVERPPIKASFFNDGFEANWNRQGYLRLKLIDNKVQLIVDADLASLQAIDPVHDIDTDRLSFESPVESTSFTLSVGAGPMPAEAKAGTGNAMFLLARVRFPRVSAKVDIPLHNDEERTVNAVRFDLRLYLTVRGNGVGFFPVVESNLLDAFDFTVHVPNPAETDAITTANLKSELKAAIESSAGKVARFGPFLTPWFTGGRFQLAGLAYEPGAGDELRPDGIVERATGTLVVRYVGPRAAPPTEPVLDSGAGTTPAPEDGAPRLFDLPDEDPDPVPGQPGGGGVDPRPRDRFELGALAKVERIVVLMQENRSFDQVLGYLKRDGIDPRVEGLDPDPDKHFNSFNGITIFSRRADGQDPPRSAATDWPSFALIGPGHDSDDVLSQMSGDMGGFVANFARRLGLAQPAGPLAANLRLVMDHFGPDQLKVYAVLAREFGICDHWYTAHAGPTWPNRFVTATGDLNRDQFGQVELDNPSLRTFVPLAQKTIVDHLTDHNVPWRVYEHGYSFIRLFSKHTFDTDNVLPFDDETRGFEHAARFDQLPPVTIIEPDYIDTPPGNDDHPPADMADGQELVRRVVNALVDSPRFERTLLVITYDEHGGFFDHVQPPNDAPPIGGGLTKLGPRVPAFVISPMVPAGEPFHARFDHTSIGATILRRFCGPRPPKVSARMDAARDLREVLTRADSPRPRSEFADLELPALAPRPRRARSSAPIGQPQGKDDFHFLLAAVRLITGQPPHSTGLARRAARFAPGELLVYRDVARDGSAPFADPEMIGTGGWLQFSHLIAGGNGALYAVDGEGRLLFYRDATQDGTGDVANPRVIGQGGWQAFKFLCSGGDGMLYAVDQAGRLLRYRDRNRDGTGDVANPVVVSASGWAEHRFVTAGGDGHIYAVDAAGQLLFHRDSMRNAADAVSAPSVIGRGGWSAMQHVVAGGNGILYAVDSGGRLLFFRDAPTRNGTREINDPTIIEASGWSRFKHVTADGRGLVYAVPAQTSR